LWMKFGWPCAGAPAASLERQQSVEAERFLNPQAQMHFRF